MKYSIVIVAYNAFDYLEMCLKSVAAASQYNHEVIVVDNSPDGMPAALQVYVNQYSRDGQNHGFAEGCNIGARMAAGDILVFLNPDAEVFPEWLEQMAKYLEEDVAAVGPISNFVAGPQGATYHLQLQETPAENADLAASTLRGRGVFSKLLIGFCLMIRRDFYWQQLGGMDPDLFLGNDDLDLSWRISLAGYRMVIASDVYVHHHGHKCFQTRPGAEIKKLLRESENHLRNKLLDYYVGKPPTAVELWGVNFFYTGPVRPMTLSIVMIVRNERKNLVQLFPQLGFADQLVIVDTGSEREEVRWLEDYRFFYGEQWGDEQKVIISHFPWSDNFAAARNHALSLATMDWVLWLDADDRVPEAAQRQIRGSLRKAGTKTLNKMCYFRFQVQDIGAGGKQTQQFSQPRLFPNLPGMAWVGRIHESFVPAAQKLLLEEIPCDITIQHTGYADPEVIKRKAERNIRILELEEDSPAKLWNLGNHFGMLGDQALAKAYYDQALQREWREDLQPAFRDHLRYLACRALFNLRRFEEMAPYLEDNGHPDAFFLAGRLWEERGDRMKAILHYRDYIDYTGKPFFWPWESSFPVMRPAAYAAMIVLMEEEFNARQGAFLEEYPEQVAAG